MMLPLLTLCCAIPIDRDENNRQSPVMNGQPLVSSKCERPDQRFVAEWS